MECSLGWLCIGQSLYLFSSKASIRAGGGEKKSTVRGCEIETGPVGKGPQGTSSGMSLLEARMQRELVLCYLTSLPGSYSKSLRNPDRKQPDSSSGRLLY